MAETRFSRLEREPLFEERLPVGVAPISLVKAARIRFAPGQPTGLHPHPVSTCGVVTQGAFIFQLEGEASPRRLRTGDGFFEPALRTVLHFDNASDSEPAEIVCFYLADTADRPPIEMLAGGLASQLGEDPS